MCIFILIKSIYGYRICTTSWNCISFFVCEKKILPSMKIEFQCKFSCKVVLGIGYTFNIRISILCRCKNVCLRKVSIPYGDQECIFPISWVVFLSCERREKKWQINIVHMLKMVKEKQERIQKENITKTYS